MKRSLYVLVAVCGLAALGWWANANRHAWSGTTRLVDPAPAGATTSVATPSATQPPAGGAPVPVGVEVSAVRVGALSESVSAVGTLRAAESVMLRPEIAGRVARIGFDGGQRVRRGDLLVALDTTVASAEADQSRAELALARTNFERTVELARQKFVSDSARDEAAATRRVQEAKVKLAEAKLAKAEIRAPFGGVLGLRNFSVGDYVREGQDLVLLEDVSVMKVDLRLPERYFGRVQAGQPIQVEFDAFPGRPFRATVRAVDVQVDAQGRSMIVRGELSNPDGNLLRSGMFAKASLVLSEDPAAMMVPEEALMPAGAEIFVMRVIDGRAVRTRVVTGQRRAGWVQVVDGLSAEDQIVTAGQLKIQRDGQPVRVVAHAPSEHEPAASASSTVAR